MKPTSSNHVELGRRGERAVAERLTAAGWPILARNWRSAQGEIDLIALDPIRREIAIVEVKTRSGLGYGSGAHAVTADKLSRLRRLASEWLREHDVGGLGVRIDVAAVLLASGREPVIDYVRGAYR